MHLKPYLKKPSPYDSNLRYDVYFDFIHGVLVYLSRGMVISIIDGSLLTPIRLSALKRFYHKIRAKLQRAARARRRAKELFHPQPNNVARPVVQDQEQIDAYFKYLFFSQYLYYFWNTPFMSMPLLEQNSDMVLQQEAARVRLGQ